MKQRIVLLLDVTGSMGSIRDQTIKAINEYVESQKQNSPKSTRFSLILFSSVRFETVVDNLKLADVPPLTREIYDPNGSTPLLDSVGKTIHLIEGQLTKKEDVVFVVLADGEENCSMEFNRAALANLVERKTEEDGWTFVFMGTDIDAWDEGGKMAIPKGNIQDFVKADIVASVQNLSYATSRHLHRAGGSTTNANFWEGKK